MVALRQYTVKMAGVEGVEPSHTVPETAVLPLDDTPSAYRLSLIHIYALYRMDGEALEAGAQVEELA